MVFTRARPLLNSFACVKPISRGSVHAKVPSIHPQQRTSSALSSHAVQRSRKIDDTLSRIRYLPRELHATKPPISRLVYMQRRPHSQSGFSPFRPFDPAPLVVGSTIGLCCAGYVAKWWAEQRAENLHDHGPAEFIEDNFIDSKDNIEAGRWWVGLTSSVMHFNFLHLGLNMFVLWDFGPLVVHAFGTPAFYGIWIVSSATCSAAWLAWHKRLKDVGARTTGTRWDETGRKEQQQRRWFAPKDAAAYGGGVGASGAIIGMIGAITCFAPRVRTSFFFLPVSMPLWVSLGLLTSFSLYCMDSGWIPQIGHAAHLGGTAGGILSYYGAVRPWLRRTGRL